MIKNTLKEKIKVKLRERNGDIGGINVIVVMLAVVMLFAITSQLIKPFMIVQNVQQMVQKAVIDTATANAYGIYPGVRESNSANVDYNDYATSWTVIDLNKDVTGQLMRLLKLGSNDGGLEQLSNGKLQFKITDLSTSYTGATLRSGNETCLNFNTTLTLHIPLRFGQSEPLVTIRQKMTIKSRYLPLY